MPRSLIILFIGLITLPAYAGTWTQTTSADFESGTYTDAVILNETIISTNGKLYNLCVGDNQDTYMPTATTYWTPTPTGTITQIFINQETELNYDWFYVYDANNCEIWSTTGIFNQWIDIDETTGIKDRVVTDSLYWNYFGGDIPKVKLSDGCIVLVATTTYYFNDDFETGAPGWTKRPNDAAWHLVEDGVSPYPNSHSPTHSGWYGQDATGDYEIGKVRNWGYVRSPWIDLTSVTQATLNWWHWSETEEHGEPGYDRQVVYVYDGSVEHQVWYWDAVSDNIQPWRRESVDISAYVGQQVQIRFLFDTVDGLYNDYRGWYIDNVTIQASGYFLSGTFASAAYDTGNISDFNFIYWTADTTGTGTSVKFQIRTAATEGELNTATWYGPTGTGDYYTTSGTSINSIHNNDRWVQYRVILETTDPDYTPSLHDVTIIYTCNLPPNSFSLISPLNDSYTKDLTPTFDWEDSSDSNSGDTITYTLWYSIDPTFSIKTEVTGLGTSIYTPTTNLNDMSTYYWKVKAVDNHLAQTWSNETNCLNINTTNSPPNSFSLLLPTNGTETTNLTSPFDWEDTIDPDPGDTVTYTLWYSTDSNFTTKIEVTGLMVSNYTPSTNLIDNSIYYWKVNAVDNHGVYRWSNQIDWQFSTNVANELPTNFSLIEPDNLSVTNDLTPTFTWGISTDPDPQDTITYTIWYSTDTTFATKTEISGLGSNTYTPATDLEDNSTYYWKVKAIDNHGSSTWGSQTDWSFSTNARNKPPYNFSLNSPDNGVTTDLRPTFDWDDTVDPEGGTITYTLWYSTDSSFITKTEITGLTSSRYTPTSDLVDNSTYYWKVRAVDNNNAYTWSNETNWSINTDATAWTQTDEQDFSLGLLNNVGTTSSPGDVKLTPLSYPYHESLINNEFMTGGIAQNWRHNERVWQYTLPFTFPFYGTDYNTVWVSSNGFLNLTSTTNADYDNTSAKLKNNLRIAPLWDNLRTDGTAQTGEDIYIHQPTTDSIYIRWCGQTHSGNYPVNFGVVLYQNGTIKFNYGSGNTGLTPTVGISNGDGTNYLFSNYNMNNSITNAQTSLIERNYQGSGSLQSSGYDTGQESTFDNIYFSADISGVTSLVFQIRTAGTEGALSSATWYGPTGTGDYYTTSATAINSIHNGDRWVQYKASFTTTNSADTPNLRDITIAYSSTPVGVDHFHVTGITNPISIGVSSDVKVIAHDASHNVVTNYIGTITFTSSDPLAILPNDYKFTLADAGTKTFTAGVTFNTIGTQSVSVMDVADNSIRGTQSDINVVGANIVVTKDMIVNHEWDGGTNTIPGATIIYVITYINDGNDTAGSVTITDKLMNYAIYATNSLRIGTSGSTYESATPKTDAKDIESGGSADWNVNIPQAVTFELGSIPVGASGRLYFKVRVD
ncbi:MAG: hypothetical protein AB1414_02775 [bacterium]